MSPSRAGSAFAIGTGRCGTHLLAELLDGEAGVVSCHESDPFGEAFHRYCVWNALAVDDEGFLAAKRQEIDRAGAFGQAFFEASAYLCLSTRALYDAFGSRFVVITRDPVDTVNSLWVKGWYDVDYARRDPGRALGYHRVGEPHHFFSRIVPNGDEFERWKGLTRIGKLGWYWRTLNGRMLDDLAALPGGRGRTIRLEDLDHAEYRSLAEFVGVASTLSRERFESIVSARPGAFPAQRSMSSWDRTELDEFAAQVTTVADRLGYDTDFEARWEQQRALSNAAGLRSDGPTIPPRARSTREAGEC